MAFNRLGPIGPGSPELTIRAARGVYVWDDAGRRYVDLIAGLLVNLLGHRVPAVGRAVRRQLNRHDHVMVYGVWPQPVQERFARALLSVMPASFCAVYPTCTGTEAVEAAVRFACAITRRRRIITFEGAYHGETQGSLQLMGTDAYRSVFGWTRGDVIQLPWNDPTVFNHLEPPVAAVIFEPIQGEAGVRPASKTFLRALFQWARRTGALVIADEVQTGLGRTGRWWAGVGPWGTPDMIVTGKAVGGGFPLGAVAVPEYVRDGLVKLPVIPHLTTFGGHPVACAAGRALIQELKRQRWPRRVRRRSRWFRQRLMALMKAHGHWLVEVRGRGFMWGLEFVDEDVAQRVEKGMRDRGYLVDRPLFASRVIRLAPPINIKRKILDAALAALDATLTSLENRSDGAWDR